MGFDREMLVRIDIPYHFQKTETLRQKVGSVSFVKGNTVSSGCRE